MEKESISLDTKKMKQTSKAFNDRSGAKKYREAKARRDKNGYDKSSTDGLRERYKDQEIIDAWEKDEE